MEPKFSKALTDAMLDQMIHGTGVVYVDLAGMSEQAPVATSIADIHAKQQEERNKMLRAILDAQAKAWAMTPQMIIEPTPAPEPPAPVEKPVKRMDEMTFADFRKGVDAWWDKRPR